MAAAQGARPIYSRLSLSGGQHTSIRSSQHEYGSATCKIDFSAISDIYYAVPDFLMPASLQHWEYDSKSPSKNRKISKT